MKKDAFALLSLLSFAMISYGQEKTKIEENGVVVTSKNYQIVDEYSAHNDSENQYICTEEDAIQEYEQYVCDHISIKPPKPASISALLTNLGCSLLIHYIALTEKAKVCMASLRNAIAKWVCAHS